MDAVVRLAAAPEDQDVSIRLFSSSSSSAAAAPLTVCAPAAWLSDVPYFATRLKEPWIDSSPAPHHLMLECTPGSTPQDYLQCLLLLSSSATRWPLLFESVSQVLQILPVADHLLFKKCWDVCMGFLASSPWSIEEEDAIRATISKLNTKPSPDVEERLDTSYDGAVLKALLCEMLSKPPLEASFGTWCEKFLDHSSAPIPAAFQSLLSKVMEAVLREMLSKPSLEASFGTLCEKCLNHSSAPFAAAFQSILLKVMESFSVYKVMELPREWYVLAQIILQFTDAGQFILYLVNSEKLLISLAYSKKQEYSRSIFNKVLEKVEERVVLLSNLQRARLVEWSYSIYTPPMKKSYDLILRLAETLPCRDPIRMQVMKSDYKRIPKWIDQVSHRVSLMDEVALKAICQNFEKK